MGYAYYCSKMRLVDTAMGLWMRYGHTYRTLRTEYEEALAERKQNGLPLRKVPNSILQEFPEIELLNKKTEDEAREYLLRLTESSIRTIISIIRDLQYNRAWNGMKANLIDSRYINSMHPKCPFGVNAASRTGRPLVKTNINKRSD